MGRIRTIKPEFPQSESMGRLSRDARLLFIQLWTVVDDSGRSRAASRMLASLLYPYDDDASSLIDGWLLELEQQSCIRRYDVEGDRYLEICNWLKHQKIDRPSKSRLPAFDEGSRVFVEASTTDLGPRTSTKDLGSVSEPSLRSGAHTVVDVSRRTKRKPTKGPLPDDWQPSDMHRIAAGRLKLPQGLMESKAEDMRLWAQSNDIRKASWDATFHGFLRRAANETGQTNGQGRSRQFQDDRLSLSKAADRLIEQAERGEFQFGPRPSLLPEGSAGPVRLLPKG